VTTSAGGNDRGRPGPRWGGDGSLRPRTSRPSDDPASPLHLEGQRRPDAPALELPPWPLSAIWRRAIAWVIDFGIKVVLLQIVLIIAGIDVSQVADVVLPAQVLTLGYNWLFFMQGWTPGSRMLGMRIVRLDGTAPGPWFALVRVAGVVISEFALFFGYTWAIWDARRQTWQDKFAGTFVVDSRVDPPMRRS
jgi:uncharacterized RDD family membrane protein YckC